MFGNRNAKTAARLSLAHLATTLPLAKRCFISLPQTRPLSAPNFRLSIVDSLADCCLPSQASQKVWEGKCFNPPLPASLCRLWLMTDFVVSQCGVLIFSSCAFGGKVNWASDKLFSCLARFWVGCGANAKSVHVALRQITFLALKPNNCFFCIR